MSTHEPEGLRPLEFFTSASIEEMFYPAPKQRVKNPTPTALQPGDMVNILVGPATGKVGLVVVERNGNYEDKEPYCDDERIGVQVVQTMHGDEVLRSLLVSAGVVTPGTALERAIRWFDGPGQLELLYRDENGEQTEV